MKRVLTFLAIMLLPLSVWAMTPVSDSDLSNVTGQAGVNINADLTMNIGIGTMAWGDSDGAQYYWSSAPAAGGYVGVNDFNINNLKIKARETDSYGIGYPTAAPVGTVSSVPLGNAGHYTTVFLKPITIDVATGDKLASGGSASTTFVRFGLGSLEITLNAMSFEVALGAYNGGSPTLDQVMGTANLGAMEIYINPTSYVDIFAHAGSGVSMDLNVIVDQFNMDYVSWGDPDGLAGTAHTGTGGVTWVSAAGSTGYIGLANLEVGGPIIITGTVAIDVVADSAGIYAVAAGSLAHGGTGVPVNTTVCHISFPRLFTVMVTGPITADVKLSSAAALNAAGAGTLGDIYISGFNLGIVGGSWVDIWAH